MPHFSCGILVIKFIKYQYVNVSNLHNLPPNENIWFRWHTELLCSIGANKQAAASMAQCISGATQLHSGRAASPSTDQSSSKLPETTEGRQECCSSHRDWFSHLANTKKRKKQMEMDRICLWPTGHPVLGVLQELLKGMGRGRRKIKGNTEENLRQMQWKERMRDFKTRGVQG